MGRNPPVLLANADWYGTLAAVRELGRRDIQVCVASSKWLTPARWSRRAARQLSCPDERDTERYANWLVELGRRNRGIVLCHTSDNIAFVHAAHERELGNSFVLATPNVATLRELLDKQRLYEHARRIGLRTPETLFLSDRANVDEVARQAPWPLLLKQRSHVGALSPHTGIPVREPAQLGIAYARFMRRNNFRADVLARWPGLDGAMLQKYLPDCSGRIYCLAGFISRDGKHWATRAALKVLSYPRYLGIGLLFQHAAVLPHLEDGVLQLCRTVGYFGTFQCEFLECPDEHLLIDFNPRFYNYMAFDHARGLPQAYLSYLLATGGDAEQLRLEIDRARASPATAERMVYANRLGTWIQLHLERLFRRIPHEEVAKWRAWRETAPTVIDPVWAANDWRPAIADLLLRLRHMARHPRDFLRTNTQKAF